MKDIRTYIGALAMALAVIVMAAPAFAQQRPADRVDQRLERLDARLDLTEEQEAQIREIWMQHRTDAQTWMAENENATRDERRAYFRSRVDQVHESVEAVLTPEQATKLSDLRTSFRGRADGMRGGRGMRDGGRGMRGGGKGMRDGGRGMRDGGRGMRDGGPGMFIGRVADRLDLSDAQREEMLDIIESHQEEGRAWRAEHPEATREQMQAYHEGHFAQLKRELEHVLTPEQLDEFEELHESKRPGRGRR